MSTEKEMLGLEDKRFEAMIARDFAALEQIVHAAWQSCPQPA